MSENEMNRRTVGDYVWCDDYLYEVLQVDGRMCYIGDIRETGASYRIKLWMMYHPLRAAFRRAF